MDKARIAAPTSPSLFAPDAVRYRTASADVVILYVVSLFAFLLLSLHIGAAAVPIYFVYVVALHYVSNKRSRLLLERMQRELPQAVVVEIVRRSYEECRRSEANSFTMEVGAGPVLVICGHQRVCAELDRRNSSIFAAAVASAATALAAAYALRAELVPYVLLALLGVLLAAKRLRICRRYTVKRTV